MKEAPGSKMRQFFVKDKLQLQEEYVFDAHKSHHISHVLRLKPGYIVRLVDVENETFLGEIFYRNDQTGVMVKEKCEQEEEREITCLICMIKKEKWELVLQKACELGATRIVPVISERTIVRLKEEETVKKVKKVSTKKRYGKVGKVDKLGKPEAELGQLCQVCHAKIGPGCLC